MTDCDIRYNTDKTAWNQSKKNKKTLVLRIELTKIYLSRKHDKYGEPWH